jgi:hypothetical protein
MVQHATEATERPHEHLDAEPSTRVRAAQHALSSRFLSQLAFCTDGIGWVHVLESWRRHGVLARFASAASRGVELGVLARQTGAHLGYLAVTVRALEAQGWMWRRSPRREPAGHELSRRIESEAERTRAGLTPDGSELFALLASGSAAERIVAFTPLARHMAEYLAGSYQPSPEVPSLAELVLCSTRGWDLPVSDRRESGSAAARVRAALDGNLLGPVAVALATSAARFEWVQRPERHAHFEQGYRGQNDSGQSYRGEGDLGHGEPRRIEPTSAREQAVLELLAHVGWASSSGSTAQMTPLGSYALQRALAYGVPVSYLPLFERVDELFFGDPVAFWRQAPGKPERHVDRALNVRASGASHSRYFAAADEIILRAFDLPWSEQPLGFCDMGSGDGAWLEHVWELISSRTERGRLMREFPDDARYEPLLVGADYNEAGRSATRERLSRAGIPHLVTFGDINDPLGLHADLARRGIDSSRLLHGSSFLIHNRPYTGVRDSAAAARRQGACDGAYAWRGRAVAGAELEQNLVEFWGDWREVIGPHGMIVIELHDPERVTIGKTLTSYMLTHGLSDQFTLGLDAFERAAAEAGLVLDRERQRFFPESRTVAAVSVSHLRLNPRAAF